MHTYDIFAGFSYNFLKEKNKIKEKLSQLVTTKA